MVETLNKQMSPFINLHVRSRLLEEFNFLFTFEVVQNIFTSDPSTDMDVTPPEVSSEQSEADDNVMVRPLF